MAAISAGILLFRTAGEALEVLLVHPGGPYWAKKDLGAWSIPKGLVEGDEEPLTCALRELEEELGSPFAFAAEALIELGSVRQKAGKLVHCWAAEADFDPAALRSNTFTMEWPPRSGSMKEFPEVDRAGWFALPEPKVKILKGQRPVLSDLARQKDAE